jgi:hypothetical protein
MNKHLTIYCEHCQKAVTPVGGTAIYRCPRCSRIIFPLQFEEVAKTPAEIAGKVREIYERARVSDVPFCVLSLQIAKLLSKGDWQPDDGEHVANGVLDLLATNAGWQKP